MTPGHRYGAIGLDAHMPLQESRIDLFKKRLRDANSEYAPLADVAVFSCTQVQPTMCDWIYLHQYRHGKLLPNLTARICSLQATLVQCSSGMDFHETQL